MRLTAMQQLYVQKQTAPDTFFWGGGTPSAAELLQVYDCQPPKPDGETLERSGNARGAHTPLPARPGPRHFTGSASHDLIIGQHATFHDVLSPFRHMLEAADLMFTPSGAGGDYTPKSNNGALLSVWHYLDGLVYKGIDCKTGFTLTMEAGGLCKFAFTINGRHYDVATATLAPVPTTTFADAHVAQLASTITLTIGGAPYQIDFQKVELQWSPTLKQRKGHKGQYGEIGTILTNRAPKITINPDMNDTFDLAAVAGWESLVMCDLYYQTHAAAPFFDMAAKGQIIQVPVEDEEGEARNAIELRMSSELTEDELRLGFAQ